MELSSGNGHRLHAGRARLKRPSEQRVVSPEGAERAARGLLVALGADLDPTGLSDTPRRMAAAYGHLLTPERSASRRFPMRRDTTSVSWCARSRPNPAYAPPPASLWGCSRRLPPGRTDRRPVQARRRRRVLCAQPPAPGATDTEISECLQTRLEPNGVGVVLEAEHLGMSLRGAEVPGARTVTPALEGITRDDARTGEEFLSLALRRSG
jgi:GTP cyclohydrolase I